MRQFQQMKSGILSEKEVAGLLQRLEEEEHYVFLDTAKPDSENRRSLLFTNPRAMLRFHHGDDRTQFYRQIQDWLEQGYYLAGWFSYEFMQELDPNPDQPGAEFGVYEPPACFTRDAVPQGWAEPVEGTIGPGGTYTIENLHPNMDQEEYCRAIRKILEYIAAGDTYQVNYTFKLFFDFSGSVADLYRDLRHSQPVPYGCCIRNGEHFILSFSPELFFRSNRNNMIARPMKGTLKRGRTPEEDLANATHLYTDIKNRSENVMIVDLLRNDLSRLVDATGGGTVTVKSLFDVEQYQSVLQMTSTVVAQREAAEGLIPHQILEAIFPCGSVTGAPKIRTMEIIDELEKVKRGVYTGAIGYFGPDHSAVFNVPIRTVVLDGQRGEMGIGSGIVADSSPESEWHECLLKSKFLTEPLPRFEIIETMFHDSRSGFYLLGFHLERLASSADYFGFACDRAAIHACLLEESTRLAATGQHCRVRLTLSRDGELDLQTRPCARPERLSLPATGEDPGQAAVTVAFSDEVVDRRAPWVFHKTTMRQKYDRAWEAGRVNGLFDVLFCNEAGEITEGCITNIFILLDGAYVTPPLQCGLLNGVMRRHILQSRQNPPVQEKKLFRDDITRAEAIFLCNSVRGVVRAEIKESLNQSNR